jgi:chemotaxis protein CheD
LKGAQLRKRVRIHIGDLHASRGSAVIETILGSCVAVCLYDPAERVGGMNHILLPGEADLKHFDVSARYGINAMELLINRIVVLGGDRRRLVAKVFGGANVLSGISRANGMGRKNTEFVLDFLRMEDIGVIGQDVGGRLSRKVLFETDTGYAFVKTVTGFSQSDAFRNEAIHWKSVHEKAEKPGEITLFS